MTIKLRRSLSPRGDSSLMPEPGGPEDRRRDLILAVAQDYEWDDMRTFIDSLRSTAFAGEVCFFGSGLSRATIQRLEAADVGVKRTVRLRMHGHKPQRVVPIHRRLRFSRALAYLSLDRWAAIKRYTAALSQLDVARHFWYLDYLLKAPGQYRNVMLTDVRDVVFLGDPFDFPIGNSACFFLERDGFTLEKGINNRRWIVQAYGPDGLAELGEYPTCCAGVTIGAESAVVEYLKVMVEQLVRLTWHVDFGVDQAVHNYVLHKGLVPDARLISNCDGPVLTVAAMSEEDTCRCLEARASQVKVVHQYDRHPRLAADLRGRFGSERADPLVEPRSTSGLAPAG